MTNGRGTTAKRPRPRAGSRMLPCCKIRFQHAKGSPHGEPLICANVGQASIRRVLTRRQGIRVALGRWGSNPRLQGENPAVCR